MFDDDVPEVAELEQKIIKAIFGDVQNDGFAPDEGPKLDHVLSALVGVFFFVIALACPNCRKKIARHLRKLVPGMLHQANHLAATARRTTHWHLH